MKTVFVTGGTGILGKRVVKLLVARGNQVVALSRSISNTEVLKGLGAIPVEINIFDRNSVIKHLAGVHAVMHLATSIPQKPMPKKIDWALNDRLRTEATQILLDGCREHNISQFFLPSLTFLYGDQQGCPVRDDTPLPTKQNPLMVSALQMEQKVIDAARQDLNYSIIRYGVYYSADSYHTRQMVADISKRKMPMLGKGDFYMNVIHADDAADALMYAFEHFDLLKNRILNVSDYHPIRYAELVEAIRNVANAPTPISIPMWLARFLLGKDRFSYITASSKILHDPLLSAWQPKYPSFPSAIREIYWEILRQNIPAK